MNRKKLIYFNQFYIYKINEIFKLYKLVYNLIIDNKTRNENCYPFPNFHNK